MAVGAVHCRACGAPVLRPDGLTGIETSDRSYGVAVALCGVFGIVGVHHFYLGNWLHGLFDVGLFVGTIAFLIAGEASGDGTYYIVAAAMLVVDVLHTLVIFWRLIVGKARDGNGRLVRYERRI